MKDYIRIAHQQDSVIYPLDKLLKCEPSTTKEGVTLEYLNESIFCKCKSAKHAYLIADQINGLLKIKKHIITIEVDASDAMMKAEIYLMDKKERVTFEKSTNIITPPLDYGLNFLGLNSNK